MREDDGLPGCHRVTVATLLLKAARRRGRRLQITEWPGGDVGSTDLKVGAPALAAVLRGAAYVPLAPVGGRVPPAVTLPWGSRVRLRAGAEAAVIVTGPAYVRKGYWALEVVEVFQGKAAESTAEERARQLLRVGYRPRSSVVVR
ncbi:MAG: hypothetical protein JSR66_01285 [Proteobacteria bacterium]|nr:hypothetical protein [Pseudomonadota bacterium]